jgi:alpha-galactosidase
MLADRAFDVSPERLKYSAAGINHLTWITELKLDGEDVYPVLKDKLIECGLDKEEPISFELLNIYGRYPAPGDWHVNEFFPHYLRENVKKAKNINLRGFDTAAMIEGRKNWKDRVEKIKSGEIGFKEYGSSGETATHFMRALTLGVPAMEMCNVLNRGYIANISSDIAVEVPVYIDEFGLHPKKVELPDAIAAKCETLGREYKLIVDGAVEFDKNKLLAAMMIDPLCCNCDCPEKLLDELLEAYLPLLPDGWKK